MSIENSSTEIVQKPKQVRIAISLLYAYAVVSFLTDLTLSIINGNFSVGLLLYQVVIFLVSIFLIFTISKGKTWARNVLLLFLILGTCSSLYFLPNIIDELKYQFVISAIKYSLGLISTILLYLKPAQQWFATFKGTHNGGQSS